MEAPIPPQAPVPATVKKSLSQVIKGIPSEDQLAQIASIFKLTFAKDKDYDRYRSQYAYIWAQAGGVVVSAMGYIKGKAGTFQEGYFLIMQIGTHPDKKGCAWRCIDELKKEVRAEKKFQGILSSADFGAVDFHMRQGFRKAIFQKTGAKKETIPKCATGLECEGAATMYWTKRMK